MSHLSRRSFLKKSAVGGLFMGITAKSYRATFGAEVPSERVRVGMIGVGNQGGPHNNMKYFLNNIEALCDRVMVIHHGRLIHDGPLQDIVNRFAGYKILTLRFHDGSMPAHFDDVGEVLALNPPKVSLRLPREQVAMQVGRLLANYPIDDISVEDPPIEDVIRQMYQAVSDGEAAPASSAESPHA